MKESKFTQVSSKMMYSLFVAILFQLIFFSFDYNKLIYKYDFSPVSITSYSGYNQEGTVFISNSNDPQIYISPQDNRIRNLVIQFNKPIQQDCFVQIYYAQEGEGFKEENSMQKQILKGDVAIHFTFHTDVYALIRVDLGTQPQLIFDLKEIMVSEDIITKYSLLGMKLDFFSVLFSTMFIFIVCSKLSQIQEKGKIVKLALPIAYGVCSSYFAYVSPFNSAPDEHMRYDLIQYLYEYGIFPHGGEETIRDDIWGFSYGFVPYLSGIVSAMFMKIGSFFSLNSTFLIFMARLPSVLSGAISVSFLIKISEKLFIGKCRWLLVCSIIFLPQFFYITTYMNNDIMALMSIFIIIYYWILGNETDWSRNTIEGLAVGLSICILSYYNAYGYVLMSVVFYFVNNYQKKLEKKIIWKKALNITLLCFCFSGWFFIRNAIMYDGDFLGLNTLALYQETYGINLVNTKPLIEEGVSLNHMLLEMGWIDSTFRSLIAVFGYMSISVPEYVYQLYFCYFIVGFSIFMFVFLDHMLKKKITSVDFNFNLCLFVAGFISVILSVYYSYTGGYQAQGRYIMSFLFPLVYFSVKGIDFLCKLTARMKNIPVYIYTVIISLFFVCLRYIPNVLI